MANFVPNSRDDQLQPEKPGDSSADSVEVFMKGGNCKESWTTYQDCLEKKEESFETDCFAMLLKCMKAHSEYYQPVLAADKAAEELVKKDLLALFVPSTAGRDITECEGDAEVAEELKKFAAYVEGGGCKESLKAFADCSEEAEKNKEDEDTKCGQHLSTLTKCVNSHPDYYHPLFALKNSGEEHMRRELEKAL